MRARTTRRTRTTPPQPTWSRSGSGSFQPSLGTRKSCATSPALSSYLSDYFVRHCLKVQPTSGLARDVIFLVNRARDYVSKEAPQELFRNLLHSMNPKQAVETKRIFDLFLSERLNVVNEQAPGFAAARAPGGLVDSAPPAPKRRRLDENDQEERKKLATLETTEEKLQLMLELSKSTSRMKLSSGAKTFKTKFLTPVLGCFKLHCQSNVNTFATKWPDF